MSSGYSRRTTHKHTQTHTHTYTHVPTHAHTHTRTHKDTLLQQDHSPGFYGGAFSPHPRRLFLHQIIRLLLRRLSPGLTGNLLLRAATHHGHELLEFDPTVPVRIPIFQDLGDRLRTHGVLDATAGQQDILQLLLGDLPVAVPVEDTEGRPSDVLLHVLLLVQGGGQELGVTDHTTPVGADLLYDLLQVRRDLSGPTLARTLR